MPRESTRQSVGTEAGGSRLDIEVSRVDMAVRVALSGVLDEEGLQVIIKRTGAHLLGRGYRVILDGSRLTHMDYRATRSLLRWNRNLRRFNHTLYLKHWNGYLKAILCMEDWDRELGLPVSAPTGVMNPDRPGRQMRT